MVASVVIMFLNNVSCWDNYTAKIEIDDSERTPRLATKIFGPGRDCASIPPCRKLETNTKCYGVYTLNRSSK